MMIRFDQYFPITLVPILFKDNKNECKKNYIPLTFDESFLNILMLIIFLCSKIDQGGIFLKESIEKKE